MSDTRAGPWYRTAGQMVRYAGLGAIGTLGHYATLVLLAELAAINLLLATTIGFAVGAMINYLLNYRYLFRSAAPHVVALPRFFLVALAGALINAAIFVVVLDLGAHYLVAQVVATGAVVAGTFLVNRRWTFGQEPAGSGTAKDSERGHC